jgi:adenine-specific DNA methylase
MTKAKKLIEVALPIKEISAESVRDKSIRHGHISTLHLWWARRPLPVCRAVIFASLVPDPLDANCPQAFCDAVNRAAQALGGVSAWSGATPTTEQTPVETESNEQVEPVNE